MEKVENEETETSTEVAEEASTEAETVEAAEEEDGENVLSQQSSDDEEDDSEELTDDVTPKDFKKPSCRINQLTARAKEPKRKQQLSKHRSKLSSPNPNRKPNKSKVSQYWTRSKVCKTLRHYVKKRWPLKSGPCRISANPMLKWKGVSMTTMIYGIS